MTSKHQSVEVGARTYQKEVHSSQVDHGATQVEMRASQVDQSANQVRAPKPRSRERRLPE